MPQGRRLWPAWYVEQLELISARCGLLSRPRANINSTPFKPMARRLHDEWLAKETSL